MSTRFVNIDRETPMLFPVDLREWLPENHLVHFVVDAGGDPDRLVQPFTLKMAAIIITVLPILLVYPFVQRYLMKGMLLGSVKG